MFFKLFLQCEVDRVFIYVTLYITECLKKLQRCSNKTQATQEMYTLAISKFDIPGDKNFPLNAVYARPKDTNEGGKWESEKGFYLNFSEETQLCFLLRSHEAIPAATTSRDWSSCSGEGVWTRRKAKQMVVVLRQKEVHGQVSVWSRPVITGH